MRKTLSRIGLSICLLLVLGAVALAAADTHGSAELVDGTTIDQAVELVATSNLTITGVLVKGPHPSQMPSVSYHDLTYQWSTAQDLRDYYWEKRFPSIHAANVRSLDSYGRFGLQATIENWEEYRQSVIEFGEVYYAQEIVGCWSDQSCPTYEVKSINVFGSIVDMMALENSGIVARAGWSALFNVDAPPQEPEAAKPLPISMLDARRGDAPDAEFWAPTQWEVSSGNAIDDQRWMSMNSFWNLARQLQAYPPESVFRLGVNLFGDDDGAAYLSTAETSFGYPKLTIDLNTFPDAHKAQRGIFGNIDYTVAAMAAEEFELDALYEFHILIDEGLLDADKGKITAQFGRRICGWYWCGVWKKPALRMNADDLVFPGDNSLAIDPDGYMFGDVLMLPYIDSPAFSGGNSDNE